jgi:hypothetical protein
MSNLNCSEEALTKFRLAVLKKHGKIYGVLKQESDTALLERTKALNKKGGGKWESRNSKK